MELHKQETKATSVEVVTAQKQLIGDKYMFYGTIKPENEVSVLSTLSNVKVKTVNYDVEDKVNAGDVLFTLDTTDIANTINSAVSGSTASTYKFDRNEIDIVIQYDDEKVKYMNDIKNLTIRTGSGQVIPITEVAEIVMGESAVSITRENQQRYVTITGNFQGYDTSTVQKLVQEKLDNYVFPDNYSYEFGGTMNMMNESFSNLAIVLAVAVLLVYMIMASQFESLIYPFIVMFSMPLAITGGILGLFVTGQSITVTAWALLCWLLWL